MGRLKQFNARRFENVRFAAIFIDELDFGGEMMVCALGVSSDGTDPHQAVVLDQAMSEQAKACWTRRWWSWGTEFGRTPRINGNDGRDHYIPRACWSGLG